VLDGLSEHLSAGVFKDKGDGSNPRACPKCGAGQLSLKLGKLGPFVGCSNYPECRFTRPLFVAADSGDGAMDGSSTPGTTTLGVDPVSGLEVTAREGRFGPFIQLGEQEKDGEKPKRASLAKGMTLRTITLEQALALLSLPREVGKDPTSGEPILAGIGKYGPYVQRGKTYANLDAADDVFTVGMNRAVDLIVTKESGGASRFQRGAPAGRIVGQHPDGGDVTVRDGRYGAYVNWTTVNATIPKGADKETLTLEAALGIIATRIEALGGIPAPKGGKKPAKAKAPAKSSADGEKAPAKKATAKKAPTKKAGTKTGAAKASTSKSSASKAKAKAAE
jgi:DNA topoisomerase I